MTFSNFRHTLKLVGIGVVLAGIFIGRGAAAADLLDNIRQRGALRIGLEGTYPPFSFQDENGKLTGFEVEFAAALAKELGAEAQFQPTKWDGILAALESGRLDVVVNQVTITAERRKKYDFSTPYTISGIQALTRKGEQSGIGKPADLAGKKIGVGLGTNYERWLRDNVPEATVKTYDDDPTKYQDLRFGRIDAILIDRLAAHALIDRAGGALALAGAPFSRLEAGVALRKGNPELLAAIDKAITRLRASGALKRLSEKWFKADVTQ